MKKTKRICGLLLCAAMAFSLMAGCGNGDSGSPTGSADTGTPSALPSPAAGSSLEGAKIEIATQLEGATLEALKTTVANFEKDTGVEVVLTEYPRADYEAAMKTRMAANELPDVFETHGWSRLRYSEYLIPVNGEPWYEDQSDLAKGILEGDGDTAYAIMLNAQVLGVFCNRTAAEAAGVDIYAIETLDDFTQACQKIIDAGMVPMVNHSSAGDLTHVAGVFTTYDDALSCDREAQLNGTWDWESFMAELEYFSNLLDMGAYWEDRSTMDSAADIERIASGKSVFFFGNSTNYCTSCKEMNPDNEYAVIPFPAAKEGAKRYVCGGEGYACGVWKDTQQMEACRAWLAYLAENGGLIAQNYGGVPAMNTLEIEEIAPIAAAKETMERYPDAVYVNLWDREYMPSGMWGVFGEAAGMLYADNSPENLVAIKDFLKENYVEKYAAAQGA